MPSPLAAAPPPRAPALRAAALIAAVEGLVLVAYAALVAVEAVRQGATGPAEVSNVGGLVLEPVLFALAGVGLLVVGHGLWRSRRWSRAPFILGQLVLGLIGVEVAQGGSGLAPVGVGAAVLALVGVVVVLTPAVTAELEGGGEQTGDDRT